MFLLGYVDPGDRRMVFTLACLKFRNRGNTPFDSNVLSDILREGSL
uniref:Uncharacterized protein n=1 Tax=Rhizophora mucronata TaxID=61149 RepID=A0A2P2QTC5_RHIMU